MNIDLLRLFVSTFQKGSFAAVALQLNISPSSVSRAVANLEKQLNTRLFQRSTRTLKPTQAGIEYYERIRTILDELDNLHEDIKYGKDSPSGTVKVSASTTFGQRVLPAITKAFYEKFPHINLELSLSDNRLDLIENQIDVAIRHGALSDSSLIARKLISVNYFLVATPAYLDTHPLLTPEDLVNHQIVSFNYSDFRKQWHFTKDNSTKSISITPFLQTTNAGMIRECVLQDMGIALLADWTTNEDIAQGKLVRLLPDYLISGDTPQTAIWMVQPSRSYIPRNVLAFTEFLFNHFNN
ncbi:LysR family transcriptional regulator [Alteromonas sp. 5E99-2]|uniref:LysR family transcriptional regulator n=1 Tax=Alteromonas sp. 5E99-2 TaxID=2817683 RepID=UPI001A988A9F|nr:LysR family transcriptional regulator [Alteromonas sp. 5E99-2]MBO1256200.1 LysR family transcriptional regulator [Alteromonas sp. 5E99-2]